jgi:hypothetical protein
MLQKSLWPTCAFLAFVGIAEYIIFFRDLTHFFQADTIYVLYHRPATITGFLSQFVSKNYFGVYRPLSQGLIPYVLFSWFGVDPAGYRIVSFIFFFSVTVAVFALIWQLTRSRVAASASTLFFGIHTVNAYTTYDFAFIPELLYGLFYVCSVMAYVRYLKTCAKFPLAVSLLCFWCSLWSKESAITLPFILIAIGLFHSDTDTMRKKLVGTMTSVRWHLVMGFAYLVFALGYLYSGSPAFETLLNPPENAPSGAYFMVLNSGILKNVDLAMTWAFNIPRGWHAQWRNLSPGSLAFLRGFRIAIVAIMVVSFFGYRRKWLLLGITWFFVSLVPTLPLFEHFIPYYLFLPLVGFSLIVGSVVDGLSARLLVSRDGGMPVAISGPDRGLCDQRSQRLQC